MYIYFRRRGDVFESRSLGASKYPWTVLRSRCLFPISDATCTCALNRACRRGLQSIDGPFALPWSAFSSGCCHWCPLWMYMGQLHLASRPLSPCPRPLVWSIGRGQHCGKVHDATPRGPADGGRGGVRCGAPGGPGAGEGGGGGGGPASRQSMGQGYARVYPQCDAVSLYTT
jgi:hypothetical protein